MQDFSTRPAGLSQRLHVVGLETSFFGMEGDFLKLVLNASSCETATLSVLHEMKKAVLLHILPCAYEADEGWIGCYLVFSFVEFGVLQEYDTLFGILNSVLKL